ncbi:kelch-like protein 17 [Euwallacea similis]|uniref:kelch-like protein 17 n=1 Tax=Euwallacea similis TaxID=1736056 RepID=UPI00344EB418
MNNDLEPGVVPDRLPLPESPGTASGSSSIVFEASTQTPTSEGFDSPLFTNKGYCLKTTGHSTHALGNIQRMRQHGQLCDVVLKIGIEKFRAHKVVLASVSPYFFAMFNGEMKEQNQNEIAIHDMDATAVDLLLDYAYTGQITITADNVQVLLPASSLLQMQEVREACCRFLLKQLHPTNCLGIRSFADTHSCKELHLKSHVYALQNFQQVVSTEEFLLLPFGEVRELISNSQLNISSEEDVFTAVLNWAKHDLIEREKYISKLMIHVRLPLVNREFLMTRVDNEKLIRDNNECRELLLEAMRYHLAPERRFALSTTRTKERKPKGADPYLFAVGGGSLFAIHAECEVYNPKTDIWHTIAPMQWRRSRSGVTGLRRLLYVVGGYDGASDLATAECYNPLTNIWNPITPMGTKRSCLGTCSFDGLVYACGGYDGASCLSSMERFDPLTGVWCSCPAMNTRRRYCRIAVVENSIYALGGFDSTNYQASVERFDPREGKWQSVPSMSSKRSSCGVAALDGHLYCVGGNDGTMCMSSGERLNIRRMSWEPISAMHNRRATHEVVALNGRLFALGGTDGSSSLNSVEEYDPKSNKWFLVKSMTSRRSSIGAAVLDCINIEHVLRQTVRLVS